MTNHVVWRTHLTVFFHRSIADYYLIYVRVSFWEGEEDEDDQEEDNILLSSGALLDSEVLYSNSLRKWILEGN
jgi:hypothetical protein